MFKKIAAFKLLLIIASCAMTPPTALYRTPSNDPKGTGFIRQQEFINTKIYRYNGVLVLPPVRWLVEVVAKAKLKSFLKDMPLSKDVSNRLLERMDSPFFMQQLVPFLLAMKDQYGFSDETKKNSFENYIKRFYPKPDSGPPGLKHSLFPYGGNAHGNGDKKDPNKKSKGLSKEFMAQAVTLFDAVMFKESDYQFGEAPKIEKDRIEHVKPVLKDLLAQAISDFDIPVDYKEIIQGMLDNPYRLESLTISIIELVFKTVHTNYQMFARRYHRQEELRKWMIEQVKKSDGGQIWDFLRESLYERRYGVQIVVDGLQGRLVESLANHKPNDVFIKQIWKEHVEYKSYAPTTIPPEMIKTTSDQQTDFLKYLVEKNGPLSNPHYLPFFRELYGRYGNGISQQGISTTPTISVRNVPIAFTGAPVDGEGGTRLPNFHYVDRNKDRAYYFFGNDALRIDDINSERGMKTVFNRLPELHKISCNGQFPNGADIIFDPLVNIAAGELSRDFGEMACLQDLERRLKNEKKLREYRQRLLGYESKLRRWHRVKRLHRIGTRPSTDNPMAEIEALIIGIAELENEGMPGYLQFYNPWPDHFAHFKGPFSDEIISLTGELNRLDYWLGRIQKIYRDAGIMEQTLFGMAGDHGLTPIYFLLNPEVVVFEQMKKEGVEMKIRKISSDEGEGPKLNHPTSPLSVKGEDIIIASTAGGNYMIDLFVDQDDSWKRQPVYEEIRQHNLLSGERIDLVKEIITRLGETLEYAAIRLGPCSPEKCDTILLRTENGKEVHTIVKRNGERIYVTYDHDLLQLEEFTPYRSDLSRSRHQELIDKCLRQAHPNKQDTWCFEHEWRELAMHTPKPDSAGQISHLYDTDLSGTINLFPRFGIGYNSKVPGRHAGEAFHEKDAFVGVWGIPVKSSNRLGSEVNGSVPMVMHEYLTGTRATKGKNGWGYHSFSPELLLSP